MIAVFAASSKMNKEYTFSENFVIFAELSKEIQQQFNNFTGHVFIFSSEIAVKIIDPLLKSKTTEPAVVVMDDKANSWVYVILWVISKNRLPKTFWTDLNDRDVAVVDTGMAKNRYFVPIGLKKFHVKL